MLSVVLYFKEWWWYRFTKVHKAVNKWQNKKSSYESFRIWQYITSIVAKKHIKVRRKFNFQVKKKITKQKKLVNYWNQLLTSTKKNMRLKTIEELLFLILLNGVSLMDTQPFIWSLELTKKNNSRILYKNIISNSCHVHYIIINFQGLFFRKKEATK